MYWVLLFLCATTTLSQSATFYLTDPDNRVLYQKQSVNITFANSQPRNPVLDVDDNHRYQTMLGFGFCMTGGSAQLLYNMDSNSRGLILRELFTTSGVGISFLRITIGSSDLNPFVFSYDDLPSGQTDPNLDKFSIAEDLKYLIPVLKEVKALFPGIQFLGSPWSPPTWMKTNENTVGGNLKSQYYKAYADYLLKYLQAYEAQGLHVYAITLQNEPLNPNNNPSMVLQATEEAQLIKNYVGPLFKSNGITTKIWVYDHNADRPDYPITILNDADARQYVDGSAFHLYAGSINALSQVHDAHPDKNLYFTEQWTGAPADWKGDIMWHVQNLIIGAPQNWCRVVLEWNLASDPNYQPHTPGGCNTCLGAITISGNSVTSRNPSYYIIQLVANLVRPGSVRVQTSPPNGLNSIGFLTPSGLTAVIVLNNNGYSQTFDFRYDGKVASTTLPPFSVGSYIW